MLPRGVHEALCGNAGYRKYISIQNAVCVCFGEECFNLDFGNCCKILHTLHTILKICIINRSAIKMGKSMLPILKMSKKNKRVILNLICSPKGGRSCQLSFLLLRKKSKVVCTALLFVQGKQS